MSFVQKIRFTEKNYLFMLTGFFLKLILLGVFAVWLSRVALYLGYSDFRNHISLKEILSTLFLMLRFDLSTSAMMLIPSFLLFSLSYFPYTRKTFLSIGVVVLFLSYGFAIGLLWANHLYYGDAGRHITFEVFTIKKNIGTMLKLVFTHYLLETILVLIGFGGLYFLLFRGWKQLIHILSTGKIKYFQYIIWLVIHILILIFLVRGGFQLKPLRMANAFQTDNLYRGQLTLNGYYTFISSQFARKGALREWMPIDSAIAITQQLVLSNDEKLLTPRYPLLRQKSPSTFFPPLDKPKNLVLIVVESLSAEYLQTFGGNLSIMPFLDSLATQSVIFTNCYSVGTRSMEGLSAIFAGIPNLMGGTFIGGPYEQTTLRGLGSILTEQGYHSKFIHAATSGSMGVKELSRICGYPIFYSREHFPKKYDDKHWGIWDRYVLQRMTAEMDTTPTPIHFAVFTLSTHTPYLLPPDFEPPFQENVPKYTIYNSFANFDQELQRFFYEEKKRPRFNETVYLIIGDHTSESASDIASRFRIGCIVYAPNYLSFSAHHYFTSQVSIIPTIIDLLQLNTTHATFGKSFFDRDTTSQFAYFTQSTYVGFAYQQSILLSNLVNDIKLFQPNVDPQEKNNLLISNPELANSLRSYLQAYYQTMGYLLKNNRIYPPSKKMVQNYLMGIQ